MYVRTCLFTICLILILSIKPVHAEDVVVKIKTPYLEMRPESFDLGPMLPKVGPGGDGNITIIMNED